MPLAHPACLIYGRENSIYEIGRHGLRADCSRLKTQQGKQDTNGVFVVAQHHSFDLSELSNEVKVEGAVKAWLDTPDGRSQINPLMAYVHGVPQPIMPPLPPPNGIRHGYNASLDEARPENIDDLVRLETYKWHIIC